MRKDNKKLTNEIFLERVNILFNNKYDYIDLNYVNNKSKIYIYCKEHDYKFTKRADNHLNGEKCKFCLKEENKNKIKQKFTRIKKYTTENWIIKLNKIHNNFYNYNLNEIIDSSSNLKIICPEHGYFEQNIIEHYYQKKGCYKCGRLRVVNFIDISDR